MNADPAQSKPLAEAREDRDELIARMRKGSVAIYAALEAEAGADDISAMFKNAADLIEADGKRLVEADELMRSVAPLPFQTWRDQRDEWRLRCEATFSASPAPETNTLRDALQAAQHTLTLVLSGKNVADLDFYRALDRAQAAITAALGAKP